MNFTFHSIILCLFVGRRTRVYFSRSSPISNNFLLVFLAFVIKLCSNMDAVFDICYLSSDGNNVEPDDIPQTKESVWILGKKYSAVQGT